jgi:hypothetical protein
MSQTAGETRGQRWAVVSGADAAYFPLLSELVASVRAVAPAVPIGVIDAGLTPEQQASLAASGVIVRRFLPQSAAQARALARRPALAVNFAKLWLDVLFPEWDTLLFIDADCWVQDAPVLELIVGAAAEGALAVVPSQLAAQDLTIPVRWWFGVFPELRTFNRKNGRHARLSRALRRRLDPSPDLNAGVFALRRESPYWERLRHWQEEILRRGGKPFTTDGLAMALAAYADGLPLALLPPTCNTADRWLFDPDACALTLSQPPYERVGIVHLANQKKIRFDPEARLDVPDRSGRRHRIGLRYLYFAALRERGHLALLGEAG